MSYNIDPSEKALLRLKSRAPLGVPGKSGINREQERIQEAARVGGLPVSFGINQRNAREDICFQNSLRENRGSERD